MTQRDLKNAGLKVTLPRLKILKILEENRASHLRPEDIYQQLIQSGEEVSIATVYRVLTQFEEADLVIKHNFEGGHSVYELNDQEHHDHLVCVQCGLVQEFVDEVIENRQKKIVEDAGFQMTDHSLNIYGLCQKCQKGDKSMQKTS